jgi:hypothetical protein
MCDFVVMYLVVDPSPSRRLLNTRTIEITCIHSLVFALVGKAAEPHET